MGPVRSSDLGRRRGDGFSLVEVVIAVAVVALGLTAILGLLPGLSRQSADSTDTQTALGLPDALRLELSRRARGDFDGFAASLPEMSADPETGLRLVAAKNGGNLRSLDAAETPAADQYFLVVVRRLTAAPLAYDPAAAYLAVNVLVAFPYRPLAPDGLAPASAVAARQSINFNLVLNR